MLQWIAHNQLPRAILSMGKPNIILIFVDNQPAKMLGCAGNEEIHTPHLDALAARGMRFSEAFCPNAMDIWGQYTY